MNLIIYLLTRPEAYIKSKIYTDEGELHCWLKMQTHEWEECKSMTFYTKEKCDRCGITRRNS